MKRWRIYRWSRTGHTPLPSTLSWNFRGCSANLLPGSHGRDEAKGHRQPRRESYCKRDANAAARTKSGEWLHCRLSVQLLIVASYLIFRIPTAAPDADQPTRLSPTQILCFALALLRTSMTSSVLNPTAHVEGFLPRGPAFIGTCRVHSNPSESNISRRSGDSVSLPWR